MFFQSDFERNLENATSHLKLDPDWETILLIADCIRQNDVTPKHAIAAIRKKMNSANPHTASYALLVLESIVKNCGAPVHDEICSKESCEWFQLFVESVPHENVKAKMLELIQVWAFAFRSYDKYQAIRDIVTILKQKGHAFPELKEADAMFTSETAPDWSDGKVCSRCRVGFSFRQRKHHCRHCGKIFCADCSAKTCPLPKFGIEREVRVCDGCYTALHTAGGAAAAASLAGSNAALQRSATSSTESDLPEEYLSSPLAQQPQQPQRKSEQELKEEEELQLALALSQSEAEAQKGKPSGGGLSASYRSLGATLRKSPALAAAADAPNSLSIGGHGSPANSGDGSVYGAHAGVSEGSGGFELSHGGGDPELAKYMNRDYWEQRKVLESPASPSAPSPMSQSSAGVVPLKSGPEELEINEFSASMRTQLEIFVNRMKSNSSRGRNIVTDSAVQTLFMTLTSYHSRLLTYIKDLDDKRMWYEQLQDKIAQVKDSRAALDVLRQEHRDKLRLVAEEQERQRQLMMAHKLDIMRKKKQEYLQYQRQMALQRIQEQECEMAMRQEQQKALYQMGGGGGGMPFGAPMQVSPHHQHQLQQQQQQQQLVAGGGNLYGAQHPTYGPIGMQQQHIMMGMGHPHHMQQQQQQPPQPPAHGMYGAAGVMPQQQPQQQAQMMAMQMQQQLQAPNQQVQAQFIAAGGIPPPQQQQQPAPMLPGQQPQQQQQPPQSQPQQQIMMNTAPVAMQQQQPPSQQQQIMPSNVAPVAPPVADVAPLPPQQQQLTAVASEALQPQQPPPPPPAVPVAQPAEAELISFD